MVHSQSTSGGVQVRGCALVAILRSASTRFHIGDTLFDVNKARRGVLERVVVKAIRPTVKTRRNLAAGATLYVDALNRLWNEWDLVTMEDAANFIEIYRAKITEEARNLHD